MSVKGSRCEAAFFYINLRISEPQNLRTSEFQNLKIFPL